MKKFFVFSIAALCAASLMAQPKLTKDNIDAVLKAMTLEEKATLVVGGGWGSMTAGSLTASDASLVSGAAGTTRAIDRLGIPRIRFMTSHPKDLSDELIQAFSELEHLMPQLHLPVQSGSDEVLRRMNRRYTREHYLALVEKLRRVCPDIGLTSDIIVGFPGETLSQFEETLSLVEAVRYDAAYTFIYSPRKGTRAAEFEDDTPYAVKSERIQRLIDLQQRICLETLEAQVGRIEQVLVEAVSTRDERSVGGKTPRGHMVNFPGTPDMIGRFARVEITSAGRNTLKGQLIQLEA